MAPAALRAIPEFFSHLEKPQHVEYKPVYVRRTQMKNEFIGNMNALNHRLKTPNSQVRHPRGVLVARELNVFQGGRRRFGRNTTECLGQSGHGNKNNLTEFTLCLSGFHRVIYSFLYWHWLSFCSTCGLLKLKCLQAAWAEPTFRFGRLGLDKHPLILDGEKNK